MKNIVMSAFRVFGDYQINSSEAAVNLMSRIRTVGFQIVPILFDATIPQTNRGDELLKLAIAYGASGIISIGMASEKKGLCIERWVNNKIYNKKYCPPDLNGKPIDTTQAYQSKIALDLKAWNLDLFCKACNAANIPTEYSNDAEGFCCNHLAYQTRLAQIKQHSTIPYLFLHIPCCPEAVTDTHCFESSGKKIMETIDVVRGLKLLLKNAQL